MFCFLGLLTTNPFKPSLFNHFLFNPSIWNPYPNLRVRLIILLLRELLCKAAFPINRYTHSYVYKVYIHKVVMPNLLLIKWQALSYQTTMCFKITQGGVKNICLRWKRAKIVSLSRKRVAMTGGDNGGCLVSNYTVVCSHIRATPTVTVPFMLQSHVTQKMSRAIGEWRGRAHTPRNKRKRERMHC